VDKKRTEMNKKELGAYIKKWTSRQEKYVQGSRNWRKCLARIRVAEKLLAK